MVFVLVSVVRYMKEVFADKGLLLQSGGQNPSQRVKQYQRDRVGLLGANFILLTALSREFYLEDFPELTEDHRSLF